MLWSQAQAGELSEVVLSTVCVAASISRDKCVLDLISLLKATNNLLFALVSVQMRATTLNLLF